MAGGFVDRRVGKQQTAGLAVQCAVLKFNADFNAAVGQLRASMQAVLESSQIIANDTRSLVGSADQLSKRTEEQAASLEQTAAAVDQITATGRTSAEATAQAQRVVGSAQEDATKTGDVVQKTVSAMPSIGKAQRRLRKSSVSSTRLRFRPTFWR